MRVSKFDFKTLTSNRVKHQFGLAGLSLQSSHRFEPTGFPVSANSLTFTVQTHKERLVD